MLRCIITDAVYGFIKRHDKQGNLLKTLHLFVVDQTALHFPVSCIFVQSKKKTGTKMRKDQSNQAMRTAHNIHRITWVIFDGY